MRSSSRPPGWKQMGEVSQAQTCSRGRTNTQTLGFIPVAEQETTGEGNDEKDDCDHQFKLLIFIFVGESRCRIGFNVTNTKRL